MSSIYKLTHQMLLLTARSTRVSQSMWDPKSNVDTCHVLPRMLLVMTSASVIGMEPLLVSERGLLGFVGVTGET